MKSRFLIVTQFIQKGKSNNFATVAYIRQFVGYAVLNIGNTKCNRFYNFKNWKLFQTCKPSNNFLTAVEVYLVAVQLVLRT